MAVAILLAFGVAACGGGEGGASPEGSHGEPRQASEQSVSAAPEPTPACRGYAYSGNDRLYFEAECGLKALGLAQEGWLVTNPRYTKDVDALADYLVEYRGELLPEDVEFDVAVASADRFCITATHRENERVVLHYAVSYKPKETFELDEGPCP